MLLGVPTAAEFKCNKRRCKQMRVQSANATGASAGISGDKREHEGRGAAGWVILFDPVRGLDESTRQRLCSSARLPTTRVCVSLHSLFLTALVYACGPDLDRALTILLPCLLTSK